MGARPCVLGIVDRDALAIDADFPFGPTMIAKPECTMGTLVTSQANLTEFVQCADSDCLNGAVLRVQDCYRLGERLRSHHAIRASGDLGRPLDVAEVFGVGVKCI